MRNFINLQFTIFKNNPHIFYFGQNYKKMKGSGIPDDPLSTAARSKLLAQLRTCTLKHDELGQEILVC